jgi:predicted ATPase/DNA-binding SARP family transcriptional activator
MPPCPYPGLIETLVPDTGRLSFRLLGSLEAHVNGCTVGLGAPKQRLLLACLLLHANTTVARELAIDCLWPDDPPTKPEAALQVYVHGLRRILGQERILTRGTGYFLRAEAEEIDVPKFERQVAESRTALAVGNPERALPLLEQALALWRGHALADLPVVPFVAAARARLEELRLLALETRFEARLSLDNAAEIVPELSAFVDAHPFRERAWCQLMLASYRAGRQADALEAYRRAYATFADELGVEPSPELRELERAILRHDPSLDPDLSRDTVGRLDLPRPATPLVGRAPEIAAVTGMLTAGARLVTLFGPGGVGKTRLAIAASSKLGPEGKDGAVFVDLAGVTTATHVPSALADAVGVDDRGGDLIDALLETLATSDLLLVLDNFEHVVAAAPMVATLLAGAPNLRIVATSRTPLRLGAEHVYLVPPLGVPDHGLDTKALAENNSVAVFVARASAIDDSFRLTDDNAADVASICRILEGMPLAMELAAARVKLLPTNEIPERLARPLEILTTGNRDLPERHQTLRATVTWSYNLLETAQRKVFARLSVFAGGCSLEAAEGVCGADLDSLAGLLDQSLLRREQEPGQRPRFRLLATIGDFADECLTDTEREELHRAHARYYLAAAEQTRQIIAGSGTHEAELLSALETDHDNYRAALSRADEAGDAETLLRLVTALRLYWMVRGHLSEGRRWFETALDHPGAADSTYRAEALSAGGVLVYRAGHFDLAQRWWTEAHERYEASGDADGTARTLGHLAGIAHAHGDLVQATELWKRSANALRSLGDEMRLSIALGNLGAAATNDGCYEDAARLLGEALELARNADNWITECSILFNLGRAVFELGAIGRGRALLQDALRIATQLGYRELIAYCLLGLADIAASQDDIPNAAGLLAACDMLAAKLGIRFQGDELAIHQRTTTRVGAVDNSPPNTHADIERVVANALNA